MFSLDMENFEESLKKVKLEMSVLRNELLRIVNPFWSDDLEQKRKNELAHAAKLVLCLDDTIRLEKMTESPDFIISHSERLVGLEIRQLLTKNVEAVKFIQKLFDDASQKFKEQFPSEKLLVNFYLNRNFNYKKKDKPNLIEEIVQYVHSETAGTSPLKPNFIDRVDIQPHSGVSFNYNEGSYFPENLDEEIVLSSIEEKELKIDKYRKNSGTEFQWLLLVNAEVGSDSFDTFDFEGVENVQSEFEQIYLLKDFDCQVIKIK